MHAKDEKKIRLYFIAVLTTFIDMLSKLIVKHTMLLAQSITIIKNFFYITYIKNTGAAFSILNENTTLIIIITIAIIVGLITYIRKQDINNLEMIGYAMIIGGAVGNLLDRILYGYVIDFIDIVIFGYDYPVFNIADMSIVIGVILLFISMIRGEKNENKTNERNEN